MTVLILGNPDLPDDSLPLRILPALREKFPEIRFETPDPNEEWDLPPEISVIDTVIGPAHPQIFQGLEGFTPAPRFSAHDFDALANLRLLLKLGKLKSIRTLGLPPGIPESEALAAAEKFLSG